MAKQVSVADDQALAWLVKLNSGRVSAAEEQAFFAWLHSSTAHQAAYLRAEKLWEQSSVLATLPLDSHKQPTQQPASRLKPKPSTYKLPSKLLLGNWAIAVCALLAVVALGLFSGPSSSSHTHWVSAIGEQKQIRLEDGTQILLNTNSQLEVDFSRDHRLARLVRGEAYFDVHPNPARPFDVETMQGMVRVLGTHFSVQQQAADTLVTVLEGRVALGAAAAPEQPFKALVELLPNQQLSLQQAATGSAPRTINAKAALAWRDKQLVAQKQPLVEVVEELERYYPVNIDLAEPALGAREVTAVIQISALDVTLAALCRPLNLIPQYSPDRTRVTLKPQT